MSDNRFTINAPHLEVSTQQGTAARISHEALASLTTAAAMAINSIKADAFEEAAEAIRTSETLRSLTDDHMRDIEAAADELDRMAAELRPNPTSNGENR